MSYERLTTTNKNPKVFFRQYLTNINEPEDNGTRDTSPALTAELLEDSYSMRHRLRNLAKRMRKLS